MRKKSAALFGVIILALGMMVGCAGRGENVSSEASEENQNTESDGVVIRSSIFKSVSYDNQLWLAVQTGLFDEEFKDDNVSVEFFEFANGPAANEALIAGQLDVEHAVGDQPMITGIVGGSKGVAIATQSRQSETQGVYTGSGSDIRTVADLKGKRVGLGIGTFTHKCFIGVLEDAGLTEDDIELVNLNTADEQLSAYENGDIDAFVNNFVGLYDSLKDGSVVQLADFSTHPAYTFFVLRKDFIEKYPEITQRLANVLVRVQKWEEENPEEAAKLVSDYTGLKYDAVLELRSKVDLQLDITEEDKEQIEYTYNFLKNHDLLSSEVEDLSVFYDDVFIKKAIETIESEQ